MTTQPVPRRSPETLPSAEGGDADDFNELLQGMLDLTSLEGGVTAVDFIERTLREMEKMEVAPNDYRIDLILRHGVGSRESVFARVADMTTEEFNSTYPGTVGVLVKWYITPLLGD